MICRLFFGDVAVMSLRCFGDVWVFGDVSVLFRWCLSDVLVICRLFFGDVLVLSRSCFGDVSGTPRFCLSHVSMIFE